MGRRKEHAQVDRVTVFVLVFTPFFLLRKKLERWGGITEGKRKGTGELIPALGEEVCLTYATNKYLLLSLPVQTLRSSNVMHSFLHKNKQEETKARRESAERRGKMKAVRLASVRKSFCKKRTTEENKERIRG